MDRCSLPPGQAAGGLPTPICDYTVAPRLLKTDGSLETVCLHLPSPVTGSSAKKRSSYSARTEAVRNGAPTVVRYVDRWSGFWMTECNGFRSSIGPRSCMHPEIKTDARHTLGYQSVVKIGGR